MTADYDIITVGGGLGGAALAKAMAERGCRVLVLERETRFKDRVRGEWLAPWGVAEAQTLGANGAMRAPSVVVGRAARRQQHRCA
jgi:flavin-dependent dehydrogenase